MINEQVMIYKKLRKLLAETESREIQEAPFELLLKQTFSIWEMANSLDLLKQGEMPDTMWSQLQTAWLKDYAKKLPKTQSPLK